MYYVYILTNWNNNVLYTGVTNDLVRRVYEHKNSLVAGFTKKYNVHKLVYFEETNDIRSAIQREKQIKRLLKIKKQELINAKNPKWAEIDVFN
jgi:putative endonuclease